VSSMARAQAVQTESSIKTSITIPTRVAPPSTSTGPKFQRRQRFELEDLKRDRMSTIGSYEPDFDEIQADIEIPSKLEGEIFPAFAVSKRLRQSSRCIGLDQAKDATRIDRIPEQGKNHFSLSLTQECLNATNIRNKGKRLESDGARDDAQDSARVDPIPDQEAIRDQSEPIKSDVSREKVEGLPTIGSFPGQEGNQHYASFNHSSTVFKKDLPIDTEKVLDWTVVASSKSLLKFRSKSEGKALASVAGAADFASFFNDVEEMSRRTDTKDLSKCTQKGSTLPQSGTLPRLSVPQLPKPAGLPRRVFLKVG